MTFSWGSMLSQQSSLATHLLLTAWPKSCQTPDTWKPLDKIISWSFSALAKGFHPTEDWDGKALTKGILVIKLDFPWQKGSSGLSYTAFKGAKSSIPTASSWATGRARIPAMSVTVRSLFTRKRHALQVKVSNC